MVADGGPDSTASRANMTTREAVKLLGGFTDAELDDLGGFDDDDNTDAGKVEQ